MNSRRLVLSRDEIELYTLKEDNIHAFIQVCPYQIILALPLVFSAITTSLMKKMSSYTQLFNLYGKRLLVNYTIVIAAVGFHTAVEVRPITLIMHVTLVNCQASGNKT